MDIALPRRVPIFYGWRVVAVCFIAAVFAWGLGVFGASVYLNEVTRIHGWSVSLVSAAITVFYLTGALSPTITASLIGRLGPRPVFIAGALALGLGTAAVGRVATPGQLTAAFVLLGIGYACLSVTGISTTLAPWFERHQGRGVAIALMGAGIGAMLVVPALLSATSWFGFSAATLAGGILAVVVLVPLAAVVLRHRRPQEIGLAPDGAPNVAMPKAGEVPGARPWSRSMAIRTVAFWSVAIGFALGLLVQVGFFTHQVVLAKPLLSVVGAGWLVSGTGFANLLGRLVLARIADHVRLRPYTASVLGTQAAMLGLIALVPTAPILVGASLVYGFCLGQITTLSPIIIRREFGAESFGTVYGAAATLIQLTSAFGPSFYGTLHDRLGGYGPVLAIAAGIELTALVVILLGGRSVLARQS
ncbi:MFS transporter [Rhodopila sp.]|uniref:MFS transporter n=1 Tax=Rhodopila sp. TaxID=2480087 RepID=UPI002C9D12DB|nr:MFS transporter [Rhodopila sp.]HVZ06476.1 MFS transporter [Rhodopila sp.]